MNQPKAGINSLIFVFYFFVILCLMAKGFFRCGDSYWLLKTGYWIIGHHQIPTTNVFGAPFEQLSSISWVCYQWLFEVIFAFIHKIAGIKGLAISMTALISASIAIWTKILFKRNYKGFPDVVTAILYNLIIVYAFLDFRPFVASMFLGSILGYLLLNFQKKYIRWLILPLLFILWSNIHLAFIFGILWVLIEAIFATKEEKNSKPLLSWGLCLLASFVNPYGIYLYKYLLTLGTSPYMNSVITELQPVKLYPFDEFSALLLISIFVFLAGLKSNNIRPAEKIMFLISITMAFFSTRHLIFVLFFAYIFTAELFKNISKKISFLNTMRQKYTESNEKIWFTFIFCCILSIFVLKFNILPTTSIQKYLSNGFIEYIKKNPPDAPILSDSITSSEILYFTNKPVYLDSRFDMYGDNYFKTYIKAFFEKGYKTILDKENIKYIAFQTPKKKSKKLPSSQWKEVYKDNKITFWVKK